MSIGVSTFTKIETASGTATAATALSHAPTAGNTIVVTASAFWASGSDPTNLLAVSDSINGAYTKVSAVSTGGGVGVANIVGQFYKTNVSGSTPNMTITGGAGTSGVVGIPTELTGYTSQTVDVGGTPQAAGGPGTTATTTALTNSQATAIYLMSLSDEGGAASTLTPLGGFTSAGSEANGASFPVTDSTYLSVASAASRTGSETISSARWACVIAAYSDTPGGGGGGIPFFLEPEQLHGGLRELSGGMG